MLDILLDLAKEKAWLREECGFVVYSSISMLRQANSGVRYGQSLINKVQSNGLAKTPEGIAIWIEIRVKLPAVILPKGVWDQEDPFAWKEKAELAQILKETDKATSDENENGGSFSQRGQWSAKFHFAWQVILDQLLDPSFNEHTYSPERHRRIQIRDFWLHCVDGESPLIKTTYRSPRLEYLFALGSSEERKFWGFSLFQATIMKAPISDIERLFSPNFMRCFMNQLASPDRYLHRAAEKARKAILEKARNTPITGDAIFAALVNSDKGDVNFDGITKTKTIENLLRIIQEVSEFRLKHVIMLYSEIIRRPATKGRSFATKRPQNQQNAGDELQQAAATRRQIAADQLVTVLRSIPLVSAQEKPGDRKSEHDISEILALFAESAYFEHPETSNIAKTPNLSTSSRSRFRSRITSCLSHLMSKANNPAYFAYQLIVHIKDMEDRPQYYISLLETDDSIESIMSQAQETLRYVDEKEFGNSSTAEKTFYSSAKLLVSLTMLQIYNGDTEAVNILQELNECYSRKELKDCHRKGFQDSSALVEILLSLASQPSVLFRRVVQQVFTTCTSGIAEAALQPMLRVLGTKENLAGQADIFDREDDEAAEASSSEDSDVEEIDMAGADLDNKMQNASDSEGDEASITGSSEAPSSPSSELVAFDAALAQALNTRPKHTNADAEVSSISSDSSMSSAQMEKLDTHVSTIFRERQKSIKANPNKEKHDAREAITNLKARVLDLLEIYVRQEHTKSVSLNLILPVLQTIRTTHAPPVAKRAGEVIHTFARLCRTPSLPEVPDIEALFTLLGNVHKEAGKEGSNAHAVACSQASLLLVRVLVGDDRKHLKRVVKAYGETMEGVLFEGGNRVRMGFFTDWVNWVSTAREK